MEKLGLKLPEGPYTWRSRSEILQKMRETGFVCTEWSKTPIRFYRGAKASNSQSQS
jgi:hypothetical protein